MATNLLFADQSDMLRFYRNLDKLFPRVDAGGNIKYDWNVELRKAMDELERRMNARKDVPERFELGRIGIRDQQRLRDPVACLAIYFLFIGDDSHGDMDDFYRVKADQFERLAQGMIEAVALQMDYDSDNSGVIEDIEKDQPFPTRFIRG
jgi:hypothetical protein